MANQIHTNRQLKKFAFFYGSMSQSPYYKALEEIQGVSIIAKFHQSGPSGFLPFLDFGVCAFFSLDYARAANEGRACEWIKRIERRDQQFIRYLVAERNELYHDSQAPNSIAGHLISLSELNRATSNLPTHANPLKNVAHNYKVDSLASPDSAEHCAQHIAEKMSPRNYNAEDTCMEAPHIQLTIFLTRKGMVPSQSYGHCFTFSMATTEEGGLDPTHIICVDANAGAFKIKNTPETIKEFLVAFDEHLAGELRIDNYSLSTITVKSIPQKGTDRWELMKNHIQTGQQLGHEANYVLSDLHQLNEFIRQQIEKLEASRKSNWTVFFKSTFEENTSDKIMKFKKIHRDTQAEINHLVQAGVTPPEDQLTEITRRLYSDTLNVAKIHRSIFSFGQTDAEHKLNQLNLSRPIVTPKNESP